MYKLWCYLEGAKTVFDVFIPPTENISQLRRQIYQEASKSLTECDPPDLILTKVDVSARDSLIYAGKYRPNASDQQLRPIEKISQVWPAQPHDDHLHVFVRVPSETDSPPLVQMDDDANVPAAIRELWLAITIEAKLKGDFGGWHALERNKIVQWCDSEPEFLQEFRDRLSQQRWIESDTSPSVLVLKDELREFDQYFRQHVPMDVDQNDSVSSSKKLLLHLAGAFLCDGWKSDVNAIKEDNVRWIFDQLGPYFNSIFGSRSNDAFRANWPFQLIVSVKSQKKRYSYTPRSDFRISVDGLPYLLVEVQSHKDEHDRYRMLLEAACVARLGRRLFDENPNPFIVMALYIENSGMVTRYFVFQRAGSDTTVHYVKDVQDWKEPSNLFAAMFEIYNLASIIQSDRSEFGSIQDRITLLDSVVSEECKETFMSKPPHESERSQRSGTGQGGDTGNDLHRGEDVYEDPQVIDEFTRAGYTLESNDEDDEGWAPLNQLKPTMRYARRPDGTDVIVKLLRPYSDELGILQYLRSIKSSDNHTIPLLGTIKLDLWTFIILPEANPLTIEFAFGTFPVDVMDLSRQLIEGVAFLHRHRIAHLDIKPRNIVIDRVADRDRLFIIDFDLSVRVDGPDALTDHWCGTPGWMAPEIGDEDGPKCWYSPIRADLWSCGLMLRYLASKGASKENAFSALTRQLLNKNPRLRPMLYMRGSVTAGQSLSEQEDRLKRKRDAPLDLEQRMANGTGY